ncbi:hypothetical protein ACFE04_019698 [Oxalis oulophora]
MPGLGGVDPRKNVCKCDHESKQIETFSCRRTNFAETSTANEGWPGPGSQVSKWALLATRDLGFLENPAPVSGTCSSAVHRFRVSSWIVIAAHRREMYLVGGRRSPGHSPFRQWPFSPWSIGWSVQGQKFEHIYSARSRPSLQGLSLGVGSVPPQRGRESTEHLSHWREFHPHPIPNSCSPRMIVLG